MMRIFIPFFLLALTLTSCHKVQDDTTYNEELAEITLGIAVPELQTRADGDMSSYNSAFGAIDYFDDAEWAKYDLRYSLVIYSADGTTRINQTPIVKCVDRYETITYDLVLVKDKTYKFVIFADFVNQGTTTDLYYNTEDFKAITMKDGMMGAMDEARDAYYISENITVNESGNKSMMLTRPFGKLRLVATDYPEYNFSAPISAEITYYNKPVYKSFNAVNGEVATERVDGELTSTFDLSQNRYSAGLDSDKHNMTLCVDYLLANRNGDDTPVNFTFKIFFKDNVVQEHDFKTEIPIKRNHLTTILGNILTEDVDTETWINDQFDGEIGEEFIEKEE